MTALSDQLCTKALGLCPGPLLRRVVHERPVLARRYPPDRVLTIHHYQGDLTVHLDTRSIIDREMLSGAYDRGTMLIVRRLVKPGHHCLDIGANVGAVSLAMAKRVAPTGRVYAFEPGPPFFDRLVRNVSSNPPLAGVVEAVNVGLRDQPGRLLWSEDPDNPGNGGMLVEYLLDLIGENIQTTADYHIGLAATSKIKVTLVVYCC